MRGGGLWLALTAFACGADDAGAFADHDESADFLPFDSAKADGVAEYFTPDFIMDDALFSAAYALDAPTVQAFFESTPYGGRRSFLADASTGGVPASEAIVAAAAAHGINPLVLLVRLQAEQGLVGLSTAPAGDRLDFAFGCGCSDGRDCNEAYRGFDQQLDCAASTLHDAFEAAAAGDAIWSVGVTRQTLDGVSVTPQNAATAALYAYTPWVLEDEGGNWLVWNITGRYLAAFGDAGVVIDPQDTGFIGTACDPDDAAACAFSLDGGEPFCLGYRDGDTTLGMCSLACEGLCPERPGTQTMCVEVETDAGSCLPLAGASNDDCAALPGTLAIEANRFVGGSGEATGTEVVCMPANTSGPSGPTCEGLCGTGTAVPDGQGNACFCDASCVIQGDCCDDYTAVCE
jgi:hypothetical protein